MTAMKLFAKICLHAGCLLGIATGSLARTTEPDTLLHALREAASPTNALIREAYANPATRPDAFGHSLSELSIGYRLQTEEQPLVRQKGDRSDFGYFATEGYRHLSEKSTLWGHAGYRIGKRRNVVWNLASDYELIYPAITTDTVGGGDLTSEQYTFGGGYGHRGDRFGWGLSADVRAGQEYRTTDPRPRNIVIDISATLGGSLRIGRYRAGLSTSLRVYKQTSATYFANPIGGTGLFRLTGLGAYYAGYTGDSQDTEGDLYRGNGFSAEAVLLPAHGRKGLFLTLGYDRLHLTKILRSYKHLPLQEVIPHTFRAEAAWLQRPAEKGLYWGIGVKNRYEYREGIENIVAESVGGAYETIGALKTFEYSLLQSRLELLVGREADRSAWALSPWAVFQRRTADYLYPAQNMEHLHAGGGVEAYYTHQGRRTLLRASVGADYLACLSHSLTIPVANIDIPQLIEMVRYEYDRRSQERLGVRAGVRGDYRLRRRMTLFLAADYRLDRYRDGALSHYARIACGLAF